MDSLEGQFHWTHNALVLKHRPSAGGSWASTALNASSLPHSMGSRAQRPHRFPNKSKGTILSLKVVRIWINFIQTAQAFRVVALWQNEVQLPRSFLTHTNTHTHTKLLCEDMWKAF